MANLFLFQNKLLTDALGRPLYGTDLEKCCCPSSSTSSSSSSSSSTSSGTSTSGTEQPCIFCNNNLAPLEFKVVLASFADAQCSDCDPKLNATFILPFLSSDSSLCSWQKSPAVILTGCSFPDFSRTMVITLTLFQAVTLYTIRVDIDNITNTRLLARFEHVFGMSKPNCLSINNLSLSLITAPSVDCLGTPTCLVTAL